MIATWMVYALACAAGLALAAAVAERVLLAGRSPVRFIWAGAVALTFAVPVLALEFAPATPAPIAATDSTIEDAASADASVASVSAAPTAQRAQPAPSVAATPVNWRARLDRLDEPLAVAWATLSLALTFNFFGGVLTLAWMRRGWHRRSLLGVPVFVSRNTGPAVVGAVKPEIVVPSWVFTLEEDQVALMLKHEQEHRLAGDGRLLMLAQLALIVMPWNVALWWQVLRLRVAIEMDCDARVLRDADAQAYGHLLLEVARPREGPRLVGATAFAERATQLERRIRVLARHRFNTPRAARVMATAVGFAALSIAWVSPRPAGIKPAIAATPSAMITHMLASDSVQEKRPAEVWHLPAQEPKLAPTLLPMSRDSEALTQGKTISVAPVVIPRTGAAAASMFTTSNTVDGIMERLFAGISLSAEQDTKARDIITALLLTQTAQQAATARVMQANQPVRQSIMARRDSALRELITSDADRATLDARLAARLGGGVAAAGGVGGGGRSGGDGGASAAGGRGTAPVGSIARVAPTGGVTSAPLGGGRSESPTAAVDLSMQRLFDGIELTPEQQASARSEIALALAATQKLVPTPGPIHILAMPRGTVIMSADGITALESLLANDADRATLRSHISPAPLPRQP